MVSPSPALIISVLLISILSAIAIPLMSGPLRRQRLNNLVIELSGWLEEVSVRAEFAGAPCTVTITTGTLSPGDTLAQVTPPACAIQNQFVVPSFLGGAARPMLLRSPTPAENGLAHGLSPPEVQSRYADEEDGDTSPAPSQPIEIRVI